MYSPTPTNIRLKSKSIRRAFFTRKTETERFPPLDVCLFPSRVVCFLREHTREEQNCWYEPLTVRFSTERKEDFPLDSFSYGEDVRQKRVIKKNAWFLFIKLLIITSASAHDQTF